MDIVDKTETNLVALRRTIYLTIQSRYYQRFKILHLSFALKSIKINIYFSIQMLFAFFVCTL